MPDQETSTRRRGRRRLAPELEREFEAAFERVGRGMRSELWLLILVWVAVVVIFHEYLLAVPSRLSSWVPLLLIGVGIPAVLRWLSGSRSPWNRWSQGLFVVATYLDITCLMVIRVAGLQQGTLTLPIVVPVAILMSLVVVQIRIIYVVPTIVVGLLAIMVIELSVAQVSSHSLFDLAASTAIVAVSLTSAYELENSSRAAWSRQHELDELTRIDSLTGLPNRRHFDQTLHDIAAAGGSVVLAIFDIDNFKVFNDQLGHLAGDDCLRLIGTHLRGHIDPEHESAARWAGEEFAVVWRDIAPHTARTRAEQLRRSISDLGVKTPAGRGLLTVSAGTAELRLPPNASATVPSAKRPQLLDALMNRADRALYRAKASGRDTVVHDPMIVCGGGPDQPPSTAIGAAEVIGPQLRATATTLQFHSPQDEAEFLTGYETLGRRTRRLIMIGLFLVCGFLFVFADPVLKIPPEALTFGRLTLAIGLMPAAIVAIVGATLPRVYRWSAPIYIGAVAAILTAQMFERAVQTPKGFDVVPFLMPISVLLSLGVVQIRYRLLMPSAVALLGGIIACETLTIPLNGYQVLAMTTAVCMLFVTVRFAYQLERSRRMDWGRAKLLKELSRTDPLTRLPNRRALLAELRDRLTAGQTPALLLLDLDHFKQYNDRLGHIAGDRCLVAVGEQLRSAAAAYGGFAARLGGEEFAVILPGGPDVADHAESIRTAATGPPTNDHGRHGHPTTSAGLALRRPDNSSADPDAAVIQLISRADGALYQAKRGGRDRLTVEGTDRDDDAGPEPPDHTGRLPGMNRKWRTRYQ